MAKSSKIFYLQILLILTIIRIVVVMETLGFMIESSDNGVGNTKAEELSISNSSTEKTSPWSSHADLLQTFSEISDVTTESLTTNMDSTTLMRNKTVKTYSWNKTAITSKIYQQSYCPTRCAEGQFVYLSRIEYWCPDTRCVPCYCARPQCEVYNNCCPDISEPYFPPEKPADEAVIEEDVLDNNSTYEILNSTQHTTLLSSFTAKSATEFVTETSATSSREDKDAGYLGARQMPKLFCDNYSLDGSFLYIRSCSPNVRVSEKVRSGCETDVSGDIITFDAIARAYDMRTDVVYYNKDCAVCNGVEESVPFQIEGIHCEHYLLVYTAINVQELLQQAMTKESFCYIKQNPPQDAKYMYALCDTMWYSDQVIDRCNVTGHWLDYDKDVEDACNELTGNMYKVSMKLETDNGDRYYKNIFCAICNKESYPVYDRCRSSVLPPLRKLLLPFTLLFGFRGDNSVTDPSGLARKCSDSEWLGPDGYCLPVRCSAGKILTNGTCRTAVEQINGLGYRVGLWFLLQFNSSTPTTTGTMNEEMAWEIIPKFYNKLISKIDPYVAMYDIKVGAVVKMRNTEQFYETQTTSFPDIELTETLNFTNTTQNLTSSILNENCRTCDFEVPYMYWMTGFIVAKNSYIRDVLENTMEKELLQDAIEIDFTNETSVIYKPLTMFDDYPDVFCADVKTADPYIQCYKNDTIASIPAIDDDYLKVLDRFLNLTHLLTCIYVSFEPHQFHVEKRVTDFQRKFSVTIYLSVVEITLSDDSDLNKLALDSNGTLNVCRDVLDERLSRFQLVESSDLIEIVQYILTLACLSISMVCLLLALITYAMFSVLRSQAGTNNISLCLSLLLAQASIIGSTHLSVDSLICVAMGISTHFLWLYMSCWSFICCFHMFRLFTAKTRSSRPSARAMTVLIIKKNVCSLLTPAVIIAAVIIVKHFTSGGRNIGYGVTVCYLNSVSLVGIVMTGPLLLVTACNIFFFLVTILNIHRIRKLQQTDSFKKDDFQNLRVYIKLSTMTGSFWIVTFLAEATDLDGLRILAAILNGLQGVFIFVSYICNKRVLTLYLRRMGLRNSETSNNCTTADVSTVARLASKMYRQADHVSSQDTDTVSTDEKEDNANKSEADDSPLFDNSVKKRSSCAANGCLAENVCRDEITPSAVSACNNTVSFVNPVFANYVSEDDNGPLK